MVGRLIHHVGSVRLFRAASIGQLFQSFLREIVQDETEKYQQIGNDLYVFQLESGIEEGFEAY